MLLCDYAIMRLWDLDIWRFWDFEIFGDFEILRYLEILRFWDFGDFEILRFWDFEILRYLEILRFWDYEILRFWNQGQGIQEPAPGRVPEAPRAIVGEFLGTPPKKPGRSGKPRWPRRNPVRWGNLKSAEEAGRKSSITCPPITIPLHRRSKNP